jgi:hypothetical protein
VTIAVQESVAQYTRVSQEIKLFDKCQEAGKSSIIDIIQVLANAKIIAISCARGAAVVAVSNCKVTT